MTLIERMKRRIGIFGYDSLSGDEREMLAALEAADDKRAVEAIDREFVKDRAGLPDDVVADLDAAVANARRRIA
jgi:hypothetical protein